MSRKFSEALVEDQEHFQLELVKEESVDLESIPPPNVHNIELMSSGVLTRANIQKLVTLRQNLEDLRTEISVRILDGIKACSASCEVAKGSLGEINDSIKQNR